MFEDEADADNSTNHKAREQHGFLQQHVLQVLEHPIQIGSHDKRLIAAYFLTGFCKLGKYCVILPLRKKGLVNVVGLEKLVQEIEGFVLCVYYTFEKV